MFLIRLLLRLVLLLFLAVSLTMAWSETDQMARFFMIVTSLFLVFGIYALRNLRSMEDSSDASDGLPVNAWQLMWSRQTPFFFPATNHGTGQLSRSRVLGFNRMSPGFHIVCARLLPLAVTALAYWLISDMASRHLEWLLRVSELKQADLSMILLFLGMAFYMGLYTFVQNQFMARIPMPCMSQGCEGNAFLATEVDASEAGKKRARRSYQFVYICREHGHRHPTGVQRIRILHR
jgi:hypothetical protein